MYVCFRCVVHTGSDQTSLHNPYNGGYYPAGELGDVSWGGRGKVM